MASIFTKIINGDIPCYKVAESAEYFAFLDINPLREGHVLAVPKKEVDYIFDLDDETLSGLMIFSKKVAQAMQTVLPCTRIGVTVIGLEVPHAHVHLIPIFGIDDMNFAQQKLQLSKERFKSIALDILGAFEKLG